MGGVRVGLRGFHEYLYHPAAVAGYLSDRVAIRPLMIVGGVTITSAGLLCAATDNLSVLIGARFTQGLFIPALTTCLVAYLAKTLPRNSLCSKAIMRLLRGIYSNAHSPWIPRGRTSR